MNFKEFLEARKAFDELIQIHEGVEDRDYAIDILQKITKVAEYLIKSKLNNQNDLDRFDKFLSMVKNELPKLDKSIDQVMADIRKVNSVSQTPRRYNYNR